MKTAKVATNTITMPTNSRWCRPMPAATLPATRTVFMLSLSTRLRTFFDPDIGSSGKVTCPLSDKFNRIDLPTSFAIDRQQYGHFRSFTQTTLDIEVAAMQPNQAFHDGQPEAGAVVPPVVGGARLEERLAHPRQIVFADADAGIFH